MSNQALGGLAWRELLLRTIRESWEDDVFGQAARLAFYHFLALFPSLLLLLLISRPGSAPESSLLSALVDAIRHILPSDAATLIAGVAANLHDSASRGGALSVAAISASWASINGAWAMMDGLNVAYEVEEKRSWWRVASTAAALTVAVAVIAILALAAGQFAAGWLNGSGPHGTAPAARWLVIVASLFFCFAIFYRFAPNLKDRRWRWSTPGATLAAVIWIGATLGLRFESGHFSSYPQLYGRIAPVASLLMWLYVTGAAVLMGGEMNSEIEKAAAEGGRDHEISRDQKRRSG